VADNTNSKNENEKIKSIVLFDTSINLIPPRSESEIVLEEKKSTFNFGGALAILIFVLISIFIFGLNIFSKLELNNAKTDYIAVDGSTNQYSDLIIMNEEMLRRIRIFDTVQQNTISYKDVFDYWQAVSKVTSKINSIKLNSDLAFSVSGTANSISDVSKMWHLLSTDSRVLTVNLKSVGTGEIVTYEFEGKLDYQYFKSNKLEEL
jgi:hypothetical protein